MFEKYGIALILVFLVPYLFWKIFKTEKYMPLVVVQILTGVLLGPGIFGSIFPLGYEYVFTKETLMFLQGIAWIGILAFVWTAGLEVDFDGIKKHKKDSFIASIFTFFTPFLVGAILSFGLLYVDGWKGEKGNTLQFLFAIGMSLSVTALPILSLLLEKQHILRSDLGQRIMRYASFSDIYIWIIFSITLFDWNKLFLQLSFLLALIIFGLIVRKIIEKVEKSERLIVGIIWLFFVSILADVCGFHFIVGGFLAGLILPRHIFDEQQLDDFRKNVVLLLMPVFFLLTGLKTSWSVGASSILLLSVVLTIAAIFSKILGAYIAGKTLGWKKNEFYIVGAFLQTKGLIEVIFITILLEKQIVTQSLFTALLLMAVLSTALCQPLVRLKLKD